MSEPATGGEGQELLDSARAAMAAAQGEGLTLRLMGGIGVLARCGSAERPPLMRTYNDVDFFARSSESNGLITALDDFGWTPERRFNSMHGHRRLLFKAADGRHIDVLLDRFEMCHKLDLRDRLDLDPETLTLADLAVTKLQVVEANEKDLTDTVALFADHEISEGPGGIDGEYIAKLCATDWGLYKTLTVSLERVASFAAGREGVDGDVIARRIEALHDRIETADKSRRWRARARVGERARWYEVPEEVG